jgi:hypothetical protein
LRLLPPDRPRELLLDELLRDELLGELPRELVREPDDRLDERVLDGFLAGWDARLLVDDRPPEAAFVFRVAAFVDDFRSAFAA